MLQVYIGYHIGGFGELTLFLVFNLGIYLLDFMVRDWSLDFLLGNKLFFAIYVTNRAMFYLAKT